LTAATTISRPRPRAASSSRKGKRPFPAIRPYFNDPSFNHPAVALLDELDQHLGIRGERFGPDAFDRLGGVEAGVEQQTKRLLQGGDALGREALPFQSDLVGTVGVVFAFFAGDGEGQDVLGGDRAAAEVGVSAHTHELMDGGESPDRGVVTDLDVAAEGGAVGHNDVGADDAVVGHVAVSHEQVVAADAGQASALHGAAVEGAELADDVVVAHLQPGGLTVIGNVLRTQADAVEREEVVACADAAGTLNDHMGVKHAGLTQLDLGTDDAARAHGAGGGNSRFGVHHGEGRDHWSARKDWAGTTAQLRVPSAASLSPTSARPCMRPAVERKRSTSTS